MPIKPRTTQENEMKTKKKYVLRGNGNVFLEQNGKIIVFTATSKSAAEKLARQDEDFDYLLNQDWRVQRQTSKTKNPAVEIKCTDCDQKLESSFVTTPHRVVGKEIDVTGGPEETYCLRCAGEKIYELRGLWSKALDHLVTEKESESSFQINDKKFTAAEIQLARIIARKIGFSLSVEKEVSGGGRTLLNVTQEIPS
jgi:hypothetical protein